MQHWLRDSNRYDWCVGGSSAKLSSGETQRWGHQQKDYADVYGKLVEADTSRIIGNIGEIVTYWCCDVAGMKTKKLSCIHWKEAVKEVSRIAIEVCTLPSVRNRFISMEEE